jgi:hypothetical protein
MARQDNVKLQEKFGDGLTGEMTERIVMELENSIFEKFLASQKEIIKNEIILVCEDFGSITEMSAYICDVLDISYRGNRNSFNEVLKQYFF